MVYLIVKYSILRINVQHFFAFSLLFLHLFSMLYVIVSVVLSLILPSMPRPFVAAIFTGRVEADKLNLGSWIMVAEQSVGYPAGGGNLATGGFFILPIPRTLGSECIVPQQEEIIIQS